MKTKDFTSTLAALAFIEELKAKNKKCEGHLTTTSDDVVVIDQFRNWPHKTEKHKLSNETIYTWHVTYDETLLKGKNAKKKS
jgi:hypothetical protein